MATAVQPGQVWADNDPRAVGRTLRVEHLSGDVAVCRVLTNRKSVQAQLDAGSRTVKDTRGYTTHIAVKRFRPIASGYRLVDPGSGNGNAPSPSQPLNQGPHRQAAAAQAQTQAAQSPVVAAALPPKKKWEIGASANKINHVVIVGDESSSMSTHTRAFVTVFDNLVSDLAQASNDLTQETRISFYAFASRGDLRCLVWDMDVLRVPSIADHYKPHGMTALIDATCLAIDDHSKVPTQYGDHSFLLIVLTDGQNNDSAYGPAALAQRISARQENWTFGIFVPDQLGVVHATRCGFPQDNISVWDTSSGAGFAQAGQRIRDGAQVFMQARAQGARRVQSLFMVKPVTSGDIRKLGLIPLTRGSYVIASVPADSRIDEFVSSQMGGYIPGRAYYKLTKPETVQAYKQLAIKNGDDVFTGTAVRQHLGLPTQGEARVKPAMEGCEVFVQSTSFNRKLIGGTEVLMLR